MVLLSASNCAVSSELRNSWLGAPPTTWSPGDDDAPGGASDDDDGGWLFTIAPPPWRKRERAEEGQLTAQYLSIAVKTVTLHLGTVSVSSLGYELDHYP